MTTPAVPQRRQPDEKKTKKGPMPLRFSDNSESYVVKDFFTLYRDALPQLVTVSQGQYGEIDLDTFCAGQVMYIHSFGSQTRVIARDTRGRTFSIPADYPIKFNVVISRNRIGSEQSLQSILDEYTLPVQAKFSLPDTASFYIGPDQQRASDLSNMVLAESYQETYMLANCVNIRSLDKKTILVPVYLQDALLSTVGGAEGMSGAEWKEYLVTLTQELQELEVDVHVGNKDIAFYSDDSLDIENNVYDYIEPKDFMKMTLAAEGEVDGDIYTHIDEEQVEVPAPPIPKRKKLKEKKTPKTEGKMAKSDKAKDDDDSPSSHKYVNDIKSFFTLNKKKSEDKTEVPSEEPWTVNALTIDELGKKMKKLGLEQHVQAFKKQQVDGSILMELTGDILKKEFGFTSIETIKLTQFMKTGHIPK